MAPRGSYSSISQKRVGMVSKCAIHCASLLNNNRLCSFARIASLPPPASVQILRVYRRQEIYVPRNIRKHMCAANAMQYRSCLP